MNYSVDWDGPGETDRAQGLIDGAPEPLRRLGERLADLLDADHWNNIEPLLLEIAAENAGLRAALERSFCEKNPLVSKCETCGELIVYPTKAAVNQQSVEDSK